MRRKAAPQASQQRALAPGPMAVLRALADRPGRVVSRAELLSALPKGEEGHAVWSEERGAVIARKRACEAGCSPKPVQWGTP